jgi:hypothetical protein
MDRSYWFQTVVSSYLYATNRLERSYWTLALVDLDADSWDEFSNYENAFNHVRILVFDD